MCVCIIINLHVCVCVWIPKCEDERLKCREESRGFSCNSVFCGAAGVPGVVRTRLVRMCVSD